MSDVERDPGPMHIHTILEKIVAQVEQLYAADEREGNELGFGFERLDAAIGGLNAGDLIVVAGRPSMGKTAFCQNVAEYLALEREKRVAYCSAQLDGVSMGIRFISSVGRLNSHNLRTGYMEDQDWKQLTDALGKLNDAPLRIYDASVLTDLTAESIYGAVADFQPEVIMVDGIQSFDVGEFASSYDRNILLGEQVRQLKKMALQLGIPLIVTSPLGRELESRPNKRPILRDLRDIGMLEDLADAVLFIYRDEVYNFDTPDKGTAEILIGKNQRGPVGTVRLAFRGEYCRFDTLVESSDAL